jgi:transcriptional regulator
MADLLREQEADALELSQALGVAEKEVYAHLSHIQRSVAAVGAEWVVTPSECLACGYVFADRRRLTRPSRCPRCRHARVSRPAFRIR